MSTSENEFKRLLIIRSRINELREYWGPSKDKRTVRELLNLSIEKNAEEDPMMEIKRKLLGIKKGG